MQTAIPNCAERTLNVLCRDRERLAVWQLLALKPMEQGRVRDTASTRRHDDPDRQFRLVGVILVNMWHQTAGNRTE